MDTRKLTTAVTLLANIGILGGLILVAVEINQNSKLVEAQLESDEYAAWVNIDGSKQSENFGVVLAKSIERPEDLSLAEMVELDGYLYSYFDLLWRREALYELGIGADLETQIRQSIRDYFGNRFAHAWWEETKFKYPDSFVETFERVLQKVSPDQDQEFYDGVAERVAITN